MPAVTRRGERTDLCARCVFGFEVMKSGAMDAKNVIFGETGLDKLVQMLRASGQPQDISKLVERYLEILRELVVTEEQRA
jgi:hypothetical protein